MDPKNSKRTSLQGNVGINIDTFQEHIVKVNEHVAVQLQPDKLGNKEVSQVLAIIRNYNNQTEYILPTEDIMTIDPIERI